MVRFMLLAAGILGAFAAADAFVLVLFFLLAAVFVAAPGPYVAAVVFVALPIIGVAGGAMAWTAYLALNERA